MTFQEAVARYGAIANNEWPDEGKWCEVFQVPEIFHATWFNTIGNCPTKHIYCNKDMHAPLAQALQFVVDRELVHELITFDGCFMIRAVRGLPGHPSAHSYALALDFNAAMNKLGTPGENSDALLQCFRDAGFTIGRDFSRQDPMHVSRAWE